MQGTAAPKFERAFTAKRGHLKSEETKADWPSLLLLLFQCALIVLFYTMTEYKESLYSA